MNSPNHVQDDGRHVTSSSRHVSMRVPVALYERLETLAAGSNETVSQSARRLLSEGLEAPGRDAIDEAISALLLIRRHYPHHTEIADPGVPIESRTVNILNAKTDLQRLIDEVERGVEIIITHAGARRARLVPVAAPDDTTIPIPNS